MAGIALDHVVSIRLVAILPEISFPSGHQQDQDRRFTGEVLVSSHFLNQGSQLTLGVERYRLQEMLSRTIVIDPGLKAADVEDDWKSFDRVKAAA